MSKKDEALKLALEALELHGKQYPHMVKGYCLDAITAIREALAEQPAQQQEQKLEFVSPGGGYVPAIPKPIPLDWKLVPRKATPEMLKAMDECAQEGYDERLYAGMASSVYMAAWDASPVMGTLPEQPAQPQEPVQETAWQALPAGPIKVLHQCRAALIGPVADGLARRCAVAAIDAELARPAQQQEPVANISTWHKNGEQHAELWNWGRGIETLPDGEHDLYTSPPASKSLTDEEIDKLEWAPSYGNPLTLTEGLRLFAREVEAAHGIKENKK